jgi:hypothetical protein
MFMLFYRKSTGVVFNVRCDESTLQPVPASTWFSIYLKENGVSDLDAADLAYVEIEKPEWGFATNKYIWNESTKQVDLNPAYVAPTPIVPPTETTS